ncbi:MAG: helix-turn-helix transcriptional regulator [Bacteroidota bacterium]
MDSLFVKRVRDIVSTHIKDPEFNVNRLADEVGLSYSQLARRLRAEANMNPTRLIRAVRVEYAAGMIRDGHRNMTELGQKVGFSSLTYFSRSFKEHFGVSPLGYAKRYRNRSVTRRVHGVSMEDLQLARPE